jgi:long-chain acyl-CoA synthetase
VNPLPLGHLFSILALNEMFIGGSKLLLLERFKTVDVFEAIQKHRATMLYGVPTIYLYLLNYEKNRDYDISSLKKCITGGAIITAEQTKKVEEFLGCPL